MSTTANRNDFSQGSIPKLIVKMAVPMAMAQLVNLLYSIVDRIYLGHIPGEGGLALTGVGLVLPIISILMAFANLCGMGGGPLCSIARGEGDEEKARRIMGNSFTLLLLFSVVLMGVCFLFKEPILYLFGASELTFPYANAYLTVYAFGIPLNMIGLGLNPFINSQGFPKVGMMTVTLGAVVNLVLDPVFIFLFDMGVTGAALATVIAQGCSALWVLKFLTGKKALFRLSRTSMKLEGKLVKGILSLGLSGFVMSATNSLVQICCNTTLSTYGGDLYVGVMTVLNSVWEVAGMPIRGLTGGSEPVIGFNYGAKKYRRVSQAIGFMTVIGVTFTLVYWLGVQFFSEPIIRLFNDDPELIAAGIPAMKTYFAGFCFMALQFAGQSTFVATGYSRHAVFFSLLRKAFIVAPLTMLLPRLGLGVMGVFLAEPISNVIGGSASFLTMVFTVWLPVRRKGKKES